MNAPLDLRSLAFSSAERLRLLESIGLTGSWGWTFASNEHAWSPGLYRLLGLEVGAVRPSYDLLLRFVHPEDRDGIETEAQVRRDGFLCDRTVRVVRPDGAVRILSGRNELYAGPDGRPRAAAGLLLDITEREALARVGEWDRRRQWALFEQAQLITASVPSLPTSAMPHEVELLTGIPLNELSADPSISTVPEDRVRGLAMIVAAAREGRIGSGTYRYRLATGGTRAFRLTLLPLRDATGAVTEWYNMTFPETLTQVEQVPGVVEGLQQGIAGRHLRAARALLDWSMYDLARASGLSFSTVRRLEDGGEAAASRSRHVAVAALRRAGIRFSLLDGGIVAVSRG
ncbi:PAS domain-containing protein [Methylobacterium sp. A54F]